VLQQALRDLDRAYKNYFAGRADHPKLKKKKNHLSFRYIQGVKRVFTLNHNPSHLGFFVEILSYIYLSVNTLKKLI